MRSAKSGSSPMKVLVVTGIFPPDIGGPATYVPAISAELVRQLSNTTPSGAVEQ